MKSGDLTYEILSLRDFRIGMLRRNVKIQLFDPAPSRDQLMNITEIIWKEHGKDVAELTTVFYLPSMNPRSVAYAFGGCMKGKGVLCSWTGRQVTLMTLSSLAMSLPNSINILLAE